MIGNTYFLRGILWLLLSLLTSNFNDVIMKGVSQTLPSIEIVFWRFLFGTLSLLPFIKIIKNTQWNKERLFLHSSRGILLFSGITLWCYGLKTLPITTATVLSFTIPLFTLPMAFFFLGEKIAWTRWMATIVGFMGIIAVLIPTVFEFSWVAFTFVGASLSFALLDVINKKYIVKENIVTMLFFSALITALLSSIPTYFAWQMPNSSQFCMLGVSGIGANLVIYCLLKAFKMMEASALAPLRYLEFPFSILTGFLFFQEIPNNYTLLGAAIIIPMTLFITFYELYKETQKIS